MIFSKFDHCDRDDIHSCNTPGADKTYCLQISLRLPPKKSLSGNDPAILALGCGGPNYCKTMLFAGDTTGQLTVWTVPESGLDYLPHQTSAVHNGAIRSIEFTWKHAITCGDDGIVLLHELTTLTKIRSIDIRAWALHKNLILEPDIPRRIKCSFIVEDFDIGGSLCIGTSYGEIMIMSLGAYA